MFGWWNKRAKDDVPVAPEPASERKVGDIVPDGAALVIDRPYGRDATFAVAESGIVIWVGGHVEFSGLVRKAAHSATQVAEAA